jgi:four helix bundle protein
MHKIEELKIWQKSMNVVVDVYKLTATFPNEEKYGLTSQMRRSAVSIPSNIAEGAGRNTDGEFINFIGIANGSSFEFHTQLILSYLLEIIEKEKVNPILNKIVEIQKMSFSLINTLKKKK